MKGWYKAFGFPPDTLRGAMAAVKKRQSMTSSTAPAAGGTSSVPRSTSQPGNCRGGLLSYSNVFVAVFWWNLFQFCIDELVRLLIVLVLVNYFLLVLLFYIIYFSTVIRCKKKFSFSATPLFIPSDWSLGLRTPSWIKSPSLISHIL